MDNDKKRKNNNEYIRDKIKKHYQDKASTCIAQEYYKKKYVENSVNKFYENKKDEYINEICIYRQRGVIYKIYDNLKNRICRIIKEQSLEIWIDDFYMTIGCNEEELEIYLKKLFKDGMTYENYGEWEVDHIYPISKFDLTNMNNFYKCFNYKNLQPLWMHENRKKYNKI